MTRGKGWTYRAGGDGVAFGPPLVMGEADINLMFDRMTTALDAAIPV
ncbi:aspartate aminotransferase family protein, partial [Azospirillum brasilense]|nr:aspartate aminotransferase family protein [Azospirillum brasilense]